MNTLMNTLLGSNAAGLGQLTNSQQAWTAFNSAYSAYQQSPYQQAALTGSNAGLAQQMAAQQYQQGLPRRGTPYNPRPDWVFAGTPCDNAQDFADRMWTEPCAEKTLFVLKWAGRTASPEP